MRKASLRKSACISALAVCALLFAQQSHGFDWMDNSLSYRYGSQFREPFNTRDIAKSIVNFTHADGYKYGTNFLSVDYLMSDANDSNAEETYVVYRHTLDMGKISGKDLKFGAVRGVGLTGGFDWNTKNDPGYGSKKRMLALGPTLMMDVPGLLNISLLALWESQHPIGVANWYSYDTHPMLNLVWGLPIGSLPLTFDGFVNYIASKGKNEFGGSTAPEFNFDGQVMYDLGTRMGLAKNSMRVGLEYQYWKNKFGNPSTVPGSLAKTPMVRVEVHF